MYIKVEEFSPKNLKTQEEIQKFLETIGKREVYAGIYVSYLVNEVYPERKIKLNLKRLPRLPFLGLYNTEKTWVLKGNAGNSVGRGAKGGFIIVKGDTGEGVGEYMEGGKIIIRGRCDGYAGIGMKDGEIIIERDVGNVVGRDMKGGTIKIKANAGDNVGVNMEGGMIEIKGNAGDAVGKCMKGGTIKIEGDAGDDIGTDMEGGIIEIKGIKRFCWKWYDRWNCYCKKTQIGIYSLTLTILSTYHSHRISYTMPQNLYKIHKPL